jgi:hypothetical protein
MARRPNNRTEPYIAIGTRPLRGLFADSWACRLRTPESRAFSRQGQLLRFVPLDGCPSNPEAWLLTVARRKVIDLTRRQHRIRDISIEQLPSELEWIDPATTDEEIPDHRSSLIFTCAHTAIDSAIRAPLILQTTAVTGTIGCVRRAVSDRDSSLEGPR